MGFFNNTMTPEDKKEINIANFANEITDKYFDIVRSGDASVSIKKETEYGYRPIAGWKNKEDLFNMVVDVIKRDAAVMVNSQFSHRTYRLNID